MARVTIGLPTYNGEDTIEQSIRSVLDQTYRDLELIVADNASTDRTVEIVRSFMATDDRVQLLPSDENHGAAWNYNRVFDAATGELFRWHADDDWFEPTLIERLVDVLDATPDAVLAHSTTRFVDDDGATVSVYDDDLGATGSSSRTRLTRVVRRLTYCNPVFGLIRRDVLARTAKIGTFPASDVTLLYELALCGEFAIVAEPLYVRRPGNSIKSNPTRQAIANWFGPSATGRRFPSLQLLKASLAAIWRVEPTLGSRLTTTAAFLVVWPRERLRRLRRRRRRANAS
ncbi:MAG: glycosyltransferase family 2 protein [Actinomycetota bacterium]